MKSWFTSQLLCFLMLISSAFAAEARTEVSTPSTSHDGSFAIIIDRQTYNVSEEGLYAYKKALEEVNNLHVYIITGEWEKPDPVREQIRELASDDPRLEGFVLVGDIPIPMIRDAQHMTSSFKMDQDRFANHRSSVPSDRFYDDFDLKFDYLGKDEDHPLQHYYSLRPDSPQNVQMNLYSGRIMPPEGGDAGRQMIQDYLKRVAEQKYNPPKLEHALFTTGHGYHSESLASWEGESISLREQFPNLFTPGSSLTNLYHLKGHNLKSDVLRHLTRDQLNLAVFHAHGTHDKQLLTGSARSRSVQAQVEDIQRFLRNRLRRADRADQSLDDVKEQYYEDYAIDSSWFDGAFDEEMIRKDSLYSANQDIHIQDVQSINPSPQFIMFDQCFNGAFHHQPYIAGSYVFGGGKTVAALAHSVSVLQDIDVNQFLGLLADGLNAGWLVYFKNHLETHIIGDPTFRFNTENDRDLNTWIRDRQGDTDFWLEMLDDNDPNFRALAVKKLSRDQGENIADRFQEMYKSDESFIVRLQVLKSLARWRGEHMHHILPLSLNDPYEFIRRSSVSLMGDIGRPDYLDMIAQSLVDDHSRRVTFNARRALQKVDAASAADACMVAMEGADDNESRKNQLEHTLRNFDRTSQQLHDDMIPLILDTEADVSDRRRNIRMFRLYRYQQVVDPLLTLIGREDDEPELQVLAAETLGWFVFSHQRPKIIEELEDIHQQLDEESELGLEILRSVNRLRDYPNHPFTL